MLWAGLTYSGHPLGCAAGVAALKAYKEEGLIENSKRLGVLQLQLMKEIMERHPSVGEARSIGLFGAFEFVKNRETREMLVAWNSATAGPLSKVKEFCWSRGLSVQFRWNTLMVAPPLVINETELRQGLGIIDEALAIADAAAKG